MHEPAELGEVAAPDHPHELAVRRGGVPGVRRI